MSRARNLQRSRHRAARTGGTTRCGPRRPWGWPPGQPVLGSPAAGPWRVFRPRTVSLPSATDPFGTLVRETAKRAENGEQPVERGKGNDHRESPSEPARDAPTPGLCIKTGRSVRQPVPPCAAAMPRPARGQDHARPRSGGGASGADLRDADPLHPRPLQMVSSRRPASGSAPSFHGRRAGGPNLFPRCATAAGSRLTECGSGIHGIWSSDCCSGSPSSRLTSRGISASVSQWVSTSTVVTPWGSSRASRGSRPSRRWTADAGIAESLVTPRRATCASRP